MSNEAGFDNQEIPMYHGQKATIDFKFVFNSHVNRINDTIPKLVGMGGFNPSELVAFYIELMAMHGLIMAGRHSEKYEESFKLKSAALKAKLRVGNLWDKTSQDTKVRVAQNWIDLIDDMCQLYVEQLMEMKNLGLTPPVDEIDDWHSFSSKTIPDDPWIPQEGDFDYRKPQDIPATSQGTPVIGTMLETRLLEKQ